MGTRPYAHVWLGTPAVTDSPFNEDYESDREPLDFEYWEDRLATGVGVLLVQIPGCGDSERYALALRYYETDWDDDLEFDVRNEMLEPEEVRRLEQAAESLGWKLPGPVRWRMAATYDES